MLPRRSPSGNCASALLIVIDLNFTARMEITKKEKPRMAHRQMVEIAVARQQLFEEE